MYSLTKQALKLFEHISNSCSLSNVILRVFSGKGTLLVFSNYQMAHRVLRMVNASAREASRDFVALFVLDPAFPPLRPAASVLANSFLMRRALQSRGLSFSNVTNIQEMARGRTGEWFYSNMEEYGEYMANMEEWI